MRKVKIKRATKLIINNIEGFLVRRVTRFGNGAKVDCPKEYSKFDTPFINQPRS